MLGETSNTQHPTTKGFVAKRDLVFGVLRLARGQYPYFSKR
jgi:hypothetical protein